MAASERWKTQPDGHDYPAAAYYLSLEFTEPTAAVAVKALRRAPIAHRKAKDLLGAAQLAALPPDNAHVAADLDKVRKGRLLSPVLLVHGLARWRVPLTVADGYRRICASYHRDGDADIPCWILNPPFRPAR